MAKKNTKKKNKSKAKQKRYNGPIFVVEFPLIIELWQADIINHSLEAGRCIYNALCGRMLRRFYEMIKTKEYRDLISALTGDKEKDKDVWAKINAIYQRNGFRLWL